MKKTSVACAGAIVLAAVAGNQLLGARGASASIVTFTYTGGAQTFTVPGGVTSLTVDARGAAGGGTGAGLGGRSMATIVVAPGDVVQIMVGGQGTQGAAGWNGGGAPGAGSGPTVPAAGGGGASDVRTGACAATSSCVLTDRVLVGGGGGGADTSGMAVGATGGAGGGSTGGPGNDPSGLSIFGGGGGSGAGGGAGGNAATGVLGQGGAGGNGGSFGFNGGGGGGGGYYGGGGGGGGTSTPEGGNGGGGSGFGPGGTTFTAGVNASDGVVTVTYTGGLAATTTAITSSSAPGVSVFGEAVTFTAAVTPIPAGGTVQFSIDGTPVGAPVALDAFGLATSAPTAPGGVATYSVAAAYSGDAGSQSSASTPVAHTVAPASTTVTVTAAPTSPQTGQSVTYTAHVAVAAPGAGTPTGAVGFTHDGAPIAGCGAVALDGAQNASCPFTEPVTGGHTVGAAYPGTADLLTGTGSATVTVAAPPAPTTTTAAPTTTTSTSAVTPAAPTTTAPATAPAATTPRPRVTAAPSTAPATSTPSTTSAATSTTTTAPTPPTVSAAPAPTGGGAGSTPTTTALPAPPTTATGQAGAGWDVDVVFTVSVRARIGGSHALVAGRGFLPGTEVAVTLHSTPRSLGTLAVGADGAFSGDVTFPDGIDEGAHRVEVSGIRPGGEGAAHTWYLAVDGRGIVTRLDRAPTDVAPAWVDQDASGGTLTRFVPTEHPAAVVATMVSGFALVAMLAAGGSLAALRSGAGAAAGAVTGRRREPAIGSMRPSRRDGTDDDPDGGSLGSAELSTVDLALGSRAAGDRSWTWRWPGVGLVDRLSAQVPARLAPVSPLAARVANDGTYLRAMFGPLALVVPLVGAALGAAAAVQTGGRAVPPGTALLVMILLLGAYDALAGGAAAVTFTAGVLVGGHLTSWGALRGQLGIDLLFVAVPLAASAARPLRRAPGATLADRFDRAGDVVIAALVAAWTAKALVEALPGLAGVAFPVVERSGRIAVAAFVGMTVRMLGETAATRWYPRRLDRVAPAALPEPSRARQLVTVATQTALLVFVAGAYLGNVWELYAGAALFAVPALIGLVQDRLPNVPWLVRALPVGIVRTTALVVAGTWFGALLARHVHDPARAVTLGFVLLSLPGLAMTVPSFFAREGERWELTWAYRIAGAGVLLIGVLAVQNVVTFG